MKICLDLRSPGYAGIFNYSTCLLTSLLEIDKENEYFVIRTIKDRKWAIKGIKEIVIPSNNPLGWTLWSNTKLSTILRKEKIDLYHSFKHVSLLRGGLKKTITFHSARHFFLPEHYKWYDLLYWKISLPLAARFYDMFIVVSEAEKQLYLKFLKIPEHKVRVIHLASDRRFKFIRCSDELQKVKRQYQLPERFILFVGRILPVKNLETVIKAFHLAKTNFRCEHKMVIVGKKTWYYPTIERLLKELNLLDEVIFTGPIFGELPVVYNLAEIFILPSFFEAFPAVPLEAMACGTPVITSNVGGLPEVVGEAAEIVSPTDVDGFAKAIQRILASENHKKSLIEKGFHRITKFSWEKTARQTLNVYQELAGLEES